MIANTSLLSHKAEWWCPLQTPGVELSSWNLTCSLFSRQIQTPRTEEGKWLQFYGLWKTVHPFLVFWTYQGPTSSVRGLQGNTCQVHLKDEFWSVITCRRPGIMERQAGSHPAGQPLHSSGAEAMCVQKWSSGSSELHSEVWRQCIRWGKQKMVNSLHRQKIQ